jgi:hypothetical protein
MIGRVVPLGSRDAVVGDLHEPRKALARHGQLTAEAVWLRHYSRLSGIDRALVFAGRINASLRLENSLRRAGSLTWPIQRRGANLPHF